MIKWAIFILIGLYPTFASAQGDGESIESRFSDFLKGFVETDLPLNIDPPNPFYSGPRGEIEPAFVKKYLSDDEFYSVEGFQYGYLIKRSSDNFYIVTALGVYDTSDTWYLVTFSKRGELLDARERYLQMLWMKNFESVPVSSSSSS